MSASTVNSAPLWFGLLGRPNPQASFRPRATAQYGPRPGRQVLPDKPDTYMRVEQAHRSVGVP